MWFASRFFSSKVTTKQSAETLNCQQILSSIQSNGIEISMPELLQYQTKSALINLSAQKNIKNKMSGNYLSRNKGRGMEFDEVRHYQTGDDIRAIDWRVTARTGKTHTKLFREETERPVLIATDFSQSMHFGSQLLFKSVQAAHLGALVAWHAKSRGDRLGGIVFNENKHVELKPRSRKEGVLHYLHALCQFSPTMPVIEKPVTEKSATEKNHVIDSAETVGAMSKGDVRDSFVENCARLRQLAKPGCLVYLITDAQQLHSNISQRENEKSENEQNINNRTKTFENKALRHLAQISQHCELVICLISDPLEQELPTSLVKLNVAFTDGENRQQLTLGDKKTELQYRQQAADIAQQREKLLSETGARILHFSAGDTLEKQLKNGVNPWNR